MTRRGMVLAGVMFALVVTGAVAGALGFAALQELRAARHQAGAVRAAQEARAAAERVVGAYAPALAAGLRPGDSVMAGAALVRRLTPWLFAVEASGRDPASLAERRGVLLAALDAPVLPRAALSVETAPTPAVVAGIRVGDVPPPGWDCPVNDTITPAIIQLRDSTWLMPPWSPARLDAWAALGWTSDSLRVEWTAGDLVLGPGRHLGVFVAGGDVVLEGAAEVLGVVIAAGAVASEWPGGAIFGVAIAARAELRGTVPPGALVVQYSSCAASLVMQALAPLRPLPQRPWTPLR